MASRTTAAGAKTTGQVLTAANFNDVQGGLIAYAQVTSNQGSITTETTLTSLTSGSFTPNASRILQISYSIQFTSTVGNDEFQVRVYKDASLWDVATFNVSNVNDVGTATRITFDVGPTNAAHTYLLKAQRGSGSTGTFTLNGSSTTPAWLAVFDVGPSF